MEKELYICWINYIGKDSDDYNLYELMFTDDPETFWSTDESFEYKPCGLVNGMTPNQRYFKKIYEYKTKSKLELIQDNLCFGFIDAMDAIVALAYETLDGLEEYPEYRLVIHYADKLSEINDKIIEREEELIEKLENE